MSGRISQLFAWGEVREFFNSSIYCSVNPPNNGNIPQDNPLFVVVSNPETSEDAGRVVEESWVARSMVWGVHADWSEGLIFSATLEKFADVPGNFWEHWAPCLIPATGFFLYERRTGRYYCVRLRTQKLFCLAGLYALFTSDQRGAFEVVVSMTIPSNRLLSPRWPRMPLVLAEDQWELWANGWLRREAYAVLDVQMPATEMEFFRVDARTVTSGKSRAKLFDPIGQLYRLEPEKRKDKRSGFGDVR